MVDPVLTQQASRWLATGREALETVKEAIEGAQDSIRFETYIYRSEGPGGEIRAALLRAIARGVSVAVLIDSLGSYDLPHDYWDSLRAAGGVVRSFNPLSFRFIAFRNHRKLLLVDNALAIVGGFNVGPEYEGDGVTSGWRDLGFETREPIAVSQLARSFDDMLGHHHLHRRVLERMTRSPFQPRAGYERTGPVLLSGPHLGRNQFRVDLLKRLRHARHVRIISAYFVPSFRLRRALRRVAGRGGRVELLLAGQSDVRLAQLAARALYGSLLRAGVQIWEYQPQILHSKLAIIDGVAFVGSSNLDARSFGINYELMLRVDEPARVAEADELFTRDLAHSKRITLTEWTASRGWFARLHGHWARVLLTKVDPWVARMQMRNLP